MAADGGGGRLMAHETARLDATQTAGMAVVTTTVGPAGEAVTLLAPLADAGLPAGQEIGPGGASFPLTRTPRPWRGRVVVISEGATRVIEIAKLYLAHPHVQPLPDGRVVIAGARCGLEDGRAERNAVMVGPAGNVESELTLGDGIQDLQAAADGSLWVSYFDEGVYGNFGWGTDEGPRPLGASGLVRFGTDGGVRWEFRPPPGAAGLDAWISDCYALNVDGDTAWAYYYTDFPLARIERGEVRLWSTGLAGARALAVAGDRVLLAGGYRPDAGRVMVGRLGEGTVDDLVPVVLELPGGGPWAPMRATGRGGTLHLCGDGRWFAADLAALSH